MSAAHPLLGPFDPRRALGRVTVAASAGVVGGLLLSLRFGATVAVLGGWDAGGAMLLALAWSIIVRGDEKRTRAWAGSEDPGRTTVYVLATLTSLVSLFAAVALQRHAHAVADPVERSLVVALCLATVALSWSITHTSYTLRYAHLYYREDDEGVGGIELPGGARPTYLDFAYFAFTVGMCFQVSDVTVTSTQIRTAVLVHAVLSFAYNTVILAFSLNLVFSALG